MVTFAFLQLFFKIISIVLMYIIEQLFYSKLSMVLSEICICMDFSRKDNFFLFHSERI